MRNANRTAMARRAENEDVVRPDTLVICSGRYGASRQYTQWLIDRLGADAIPFNKKLLGYSTLYKNIIWVGSVKDAVISDINIFWQNYNNFGIEGKKVIVCGVGLGDPSNRDYFDKVMARSGSSQGFSSNYILPGRVDRSGMKLMDRVQFDKFLIDSARIYGEATAELIRRRADENYNGIDVRALEPVINEILATRQVSVQKGRD